MHALTRLSFLGLLVPFASAAPEQLDGRSYCDRDSCFRAVGVSSVNPPCPVRTADCASFLHKTVTPCAISSTKTLTRTTTLKATTDTVTTTATSTLTTTDIQTLFNTKFSTAVFTDVEPVTVQTTVTVSLIVAPPTTTTTITTTSTTVAKRAFQTSPSEGRRDGEALRLRGVKPQCTPTTCSPTKIPSYAGACHDAARYSSACSCNGVKPATKTLSPATVIATSTKTATLSPPAGTITVTTTVPATASVTKTTTLDVVKDVSLTITNFATQTNVNTVTVTVTQQPITVTKRAVLLI